MSEMIYELGNLIESKQEDSVLSSHVINDELVIEAIPNKIVKLIGNARWNYWDWLYRKCCENGFRL